MGAYPDLLADWDEFANFCAELSLKNQCISGLVVRAKVLCDKVAEHKSVEAAIKGTLIFCTKVRATFAYR